MPVIDYVPTPKQKVFHETTANEVLYGGAAGGGKSKAIVMDALFRCATYPGTLAVIFRRTYAELEETVIKEAQSSYPPEVAKYVGNRHEFQLVNGSKILFRHCEHEADKQNYRGIEIQWLYFDELTSFEQSIYDFLKTRLRAKKSLGVTPVVRSASNPGDIGHGWVKKMFVDAGPYMSIQEKKIYSRSLHKWRTFTTQYIPALATENPFINDDYIFELEQKPDALRRAMLCGDWDAFEGQVFTEFVDDPAHYKDRKNTHVIEPFVIPSHWKRYMSFDFGFSRPFSVGWWAVGDRGELYRYREWYGCEAKKANTGLMMTARQIAKGIVALEQEERENNIFIDRICDPACFDRSRGDSIAQQMEPGDKRVGIFFRPGDNTRMAGLMAVHERMRFDENGLPMLYVFNTCKDFIRTVPNLPYSDKNPEDVDSDAEDHIYDETRYMCMARPVRGEPEEVEHRKEFSPYTTEDDDDE